jgi:hypothetical protein
VASTLPPASSITAAVSASLKSNVQASIAADISGCTARVGVLANNFAAAQAALQAATDPSERIKKKLDVDTATKAIETQALKFRAAQSLAQLDILKLETAAKQTWAHGSGTPDYQAVATTLAAAGWPAVQYVSPTGGDPSLCN